MLDRSEKKKKRENKFNCFKKLVHPNFLRETLNLLL